MTPEILSQCTGATAERAELFAPFIDAAMDEFGIDTPARQAAFLAQVGHESGGLHWLTEIWGPTDAQRRYEGRIDLGNTQRGDGFKYRGRGLIQTTGRANYASAGAKLGVDLEGSPELLAEPELASRSAGAFWQARALNKFADSGDFVKLSIRINGGLNGIDERTRLWTAAKAALGVA